MIIIEVAPGPGILLHKRHDGPPVGHRGHPVIAVGGDTLRISGGQVFVNGVESEYSFGYTDGDVYEVIPEGYVFVMGDNREKSVDSRVFGAVDTSDIYGRVILRFFPFDEIEIF